MYTHTYVLENGIRVIVVNTNDQSMTTTAGIFVRQGGRNESESDNGISHFIEHLLANTNRAIENKKTAVKKILSNGGILNATTTKEITYYHGTCLKEHTNDLIDSLFELIYKPDITDLDIEREKKIILDEYRNKLSTTNQIYEHFWSSIYGKKTYGNWVIGNEKTIKSFNRDQIEQYYDSIYIADNMSVVVLTNEDAYKVINKINEVFSKIPIGTPNPTEVLLAHEVGLNNIQTSSDQLVVCFGDKGPSFSDHNSTSFELLTALWGSIPSSRLFQVLREEYNLVYQIQSFSNTYVQTGNYGIIANVHKNNFQKFVSLLYYEIERLRNEFFEPEEISRAVSVLKTFLLTKLNSPDFLLRLIGTRAAFGHHFFLNEMVRELSRITPDHLMSLANEYIKPDNLSIITLGNITGDEIMDTIYKKEEVS
ncbi:pitrilysin family protein [Alkalihalobacillus sp. AL-G]|uniref:M16 family metallopeptidase n=1 Tax=Alkalihalobacillus sp. AL-G TaxID=2926399 RepID=UPI00272B0BCB|nr:pitrilysin family protein [Alkalihalobacillus sp. AL-G]WLD93107.1 insulinase family protein [Alkalihalobacillus sp. AL-G]